MDDVGIVGGRLGGVERLADRQRWARERPWRVGTHVWRESGVVVVDLHDLGAKAAREAVRATIAAFPRMRGGAVVFVTGRGRRSVGPGVLGDVVLEELGRHDADWRVRSTRPGRIAVVFDRSRAPASVSGDLGLGFWLLVLLFALAAGLVCWGRLAGW